ncbi:toprim domain-containing protein [Aerosakkonema funiforme]|uniref:Uncharacterized protein n=1 Tax=Aerosakkonema funiforme FACHB-1375 TaxID=2949571 RepID=A0A926VKS9_9CYAN|nr:hypothetical protein [Aerosakkonema funiforme]MBD2184587.1 hypothetical protein [Aerosakkonema funiforme FACHB-1375]
MKCSQCGTDNTLKDRTDNSGRCKNCNHPFAFEPTSMGLIRITDSFFAKAIADISANNTLFFTPKQLLYFLDRRVKGKNLSSTFGCVFMYIFSIFVGIFFGIMLIGISNNLSFGWLPIVILNILVILGGINSSQVATYNYKTRQKSAKALRIIGGINLIFGIFFSLAFNFFPLYAIAVIIGMLQIYFGNRQMTRIGTYQVFSLQKSQLQSWLDRWQQINGNIIKMLASPREENTVVAINPDVTAYSFDRLVVCDSAVIAQLLIANNFHFENNCAILSITGYPQNIFATTMQMLQRNPDLKVFAFHDCSPRGLGLVHRLHTSPNWFQASDIAIVDVGLIPRQIIASTREMFILNSPESAQDAKQLPAEIRQQLSKEELEWLDAGNFVELESFTPQRLIQVLNGGISGSRNLGSDDSALILVGDADNSIYISESFG